MIPKTQSRYGPRDGNCFETCLATILEIPVTVIPELRQLPKKGNAWWHELKNWLHGRGWTMLAIEYPNQDEPCPASAIAVGKSPRGDHKHAVVWMAGKMVHDPYPYGKGLDGKPDYLVYLVPVDPARRIIRFNTETGETS